MVQFILLAATIVLPSGGIGVAQDDLAPKSQQTVEKAVEAFRAGRMHEVHRLLATVLDSLDAEELKRADELLRTEYGLDLSLLELSVSARVELVLDGAGARLTRPAGIEWPAVLIALDDRIAHLLDAARRELDQALPAPIPDEVLDEKRTLLGTLTAQIDQAALLANHLNQLCARIPSSERGRLEGRAQEIVARKPGRAHRTLDELRDRLSGRVVEYSVLRLASASATLGNESATFARRFQAAARAESSLAVLQSQWDRYKAWQKRSGTLDPNLESRWRAAEQQVRWRYGDLREKVYQFNEGTRWWLLGRYGRGPLADGLARMAPWGGSADKFANTPQAGLLMPLNLRKPEDPLRVPIPFPVARRHGAWWRYPVSPPQLVGFAEYSMALAHLERLLQMTSPAEQRVLEDMIAADDRFVVHSNLSNRFDALDPGSSLRLAARRQDPLAARPHERRGLTWIMAHARVELEAMAAMGDGTAIVTLPSIMEQDAFCELLLDSARGHYYECWTENAVGLLHPTIAMNHRARHLLQQVDRKLRLTLGLIHAFRVQAAGRLAIAQEAELDLWRERILFQQQQIQEFLIDSLRMRASRFGGFGLGPGALLNRAGQSDVAKENAKPN